MIQMKEVINRSYDPDTKQPIRFEYVLKGMEDPQGIPKELWIRYEKLEPPEDFGLDPHKPVYKLTTIIYDKVYSKVFQMPRSKMELTMVVATGLTLLQRDLVDELQTKETISYSILDVVKDM